MFMESESQQWKVILRSFKQSGNNGFVVILLRQQGYLIFDCIECTFIIEWFFKPRDSTYIFNKCKN